MTSERRVAFLARETFGMQTVLDIPELVNFGVLATMQRRITVYEMSAGATNLVYSTDLHTLPGEPPRLLRTGWIVESRIPEREPLFGDTASLAGYPLDGSIYLIGLRYPDGVYVSRWTPTWREEDLDASIEPDTSPLIEDSGAHHEWTREAARYALIFGLLLDAERAPVRLKEPKPKTASKLAKTSFGEQGWLVKRVILQRQRSSDSAGQTQPTGERRIRDDLRSNACHRTHQKASIRPRLVAKKMDRCARLRSPKVDCT